MTRRTTLAAIAATMAALLAPLEVVILEQQAHIEGMEVSRIEAGWDDLVRILGFGLVAVLISSLHAASRHSKGLSQDIPGACDEKASATGIALDAGVAGTSRIVIISWNKLTFVNPQFAIEQVQLFNIGVGVRGITGAGGKAYQHADATSFRVSCQQLAFDTGRNLLPFRL